VLIIINKIIFKPYFPPEYGVTHLWCVCVATFFMSLFFSAIIHYHIKCPPSLCVSSCYFTCTLCLLLSLYTQVLITLLLNVITRMLFEKYRSLEVHNLEIFMKQTSQQHCGQSRCVVTEILVTTDLELIPQKCLVTPFHKGNYGIDFHMLAHWYGSF
jgi:hypothetical protein